jgi:hypothetical protein
MCDSVQAVENVSQSSTTKNWPHCLHRNKITSYFYLSAEGFRPFGVDVANSLPPSPPISRIVQWDVDRGKG